MNDLILKKHDKNYYKSVRNMINTTIGVLKFNKNLDECCSSMSSEHLAMIIDYITLLEHNNEILNSNLQAIKGNIRIQSKQIDELTRDKNKIESESYFWYKEWVDSNFKINKAISKIKKYKQSNYYVYSENANVLDLIKENKKYDSVYQEKEDYKSRCKKAIELINKRKEEEDNGIGWVEMRTEEYFEECDEVINILNGSDEK